MRVALVRDVELPVRGEVECSPRSDEAAAHAERCRDEVREALAVAGHAIAGEPEALVVVLTPGSRGLAGREVPGGPCVAVIAPGPGPGGFDEADRSSLATRADAYTLGARRVGDALAWVAAEDRAARTIGHPRLVVVGSIREDFGMVRALAAEPLILGRAMSFEQHPQRPDRVPTPVGTIARHHARVRRVGDVIEVADLASTNGTIVLRRGEPARLLCPQQAASGRGFGPPASDWLIRDPRAAQRFVGSWHPIAPGDELQLPGYWRFRIDGDVAWQPDD